MYTSCFNFVVFTKNTNLLVSYFSLFIFIWRREEFLLEIPELTLGGLGSLMASEVSIPLSPSSKNKNLPHAIIQESNENNANLAHNNLGNKGVEKSIAHLQKNQLYASLGNTGLSG